MYLDDLSEYIRHSVPVRNRPSNLVRVRTSCVQSAVISSSGGCVYTQLFKDASKMWCSVLSVLRKCGDLISGHLFKYWPIRRLTCQHTVTMCCVCVCAYFSLSPTVWPICVHRCKSKTDFVTRITHTHTHRSCCTQALSTQQPPCPTRQSRTSPIR